MQRNRPYSNFRTTQEIYDEVTTLGIKNGLTNAEITRQLFLCGLKDLHEGKFSFDRRPSLDPAPIKKKGNVSSGRPDKRHSRATGEKIKKARMNRKGGIQVNGEFTMQHRPETAPIPIGGKSQ